MAEDGAMPQRIPFEEMLKKAQIDQRDEKAISIAKVAWNAALVETHTVLQRTLDVESPVRLQLTREFWCLAVRPQ